jgi:hypothetical protein
LVEGKCQWKIFTADLNIANAPLWANRTSASQREKFEVVNLGNGNFALKSLANGKFVMSNQNNSGRLFASSNAALSWESFKFESKGSGQIAIKSNANGRYVCAESGGNAQLIANRTSALGWETFTWGKTTSTRSFTAEESQDVSTLVSVYPSPATDEFNVVINSTTEQTAQVKVTDLSQRPVIDLTRKLRIGANTITITTEKMSNGMYFLRVNENGRLYLRKVVISK